MSERFIGLMSGTSRDGVDAVLVEVGPGNTLAVTAHCQVPYPDAVADELAAAASAETMRVADLGYLDARVGDVFARAAQALLEQTGLTPAAIRAIGSHGQTIHHSPNSDPAFTWQIGDPFRIAEATGIDTVAHFRQRDIAAGGEGAPLACAFHAARFAHPRETRAVLNLGGIGNITWLAPGREVTGFDCGPGNTLLDHWIGLHHGTGFDRDGDWARSGGVSRQLLARLAGDAFFDRAPPKSTGPEYFSPEWLRARGGDMLQQLAPADVQATLVELTVEGVRRSLEALDGTAPDRLLVCGGGAHNRYLMERLAQTLPRTRVESTARHGIPPQQVEGAAFAWLAARTLAGATGNLPAVTGAKGARVLGCIVPGTARRDTPP